MTEQHPIAPTHPVGAAAARAEAVGIMRDRAQAVHDALGELGALAERQGYSPEVVVQIVVVIGEVSKLAAATSRILASVLDGGITPRTRTRT